MQVSMSHAPPFTVIATYGAVVQTVAAAEDALRYSTKHNVYINMSQYPRNLRALQQCETHRS
jgi:hypothetical protein